MTVESIYSTYIRYYPNFDASMHPVKQKSTFLNVKIISQPCVIKVTEPSARVFYVICSDGKDPDTNMLRMSNR